MRPRSCATSGSARKARTSPSRSTGVEIAVKLIDEPDFTHKGKMDFVDNVIERASGTIRGRALLANPDGVFTPGMFGRVRVPGSPPYEALLVPDTAIGTEQVRKFVLVVDAENIARIKYVTLGQLVGNLRVIKDGLARRRPRHRQRADARARRRQGRRRRSRRRRRPRRPARRRRRTKAGR